MKSLFSKRNTYAIRKLSVGACSIIIGTMLFAHSIAHADDATTLALHGSERQELTNPISQDEQQLTSLALNRSEEALVTESSGGHLVESVVVLERVEVPLGEEQATDKESLSNPSLELEEKRVEANDAIIEKDEQSSKSHSDTEEAESYFEKKLSGISGNISGREISKASVSSLSLSDLVGDLEASETSLEANRIDSIASLEQQGLSAFRRAGRDYSRGGCVQWVKDRASALLGISLPPTGLNKYRLGGASAYWDTLPRHGYERGNEPAKNALAVWERNVPYGVDSPLYGHVAYVEEVNGDTVTLSQGGVPGSWNGNQAVSYRGYSKSQIASLHPNFLGYIYLREKPTPPAPPVQRYDVAQLASQHGQVVSDGDYHIVSEANPAFALDLNGRNSANGTNIHLWNTNQTFTVKHVGDGYYTIVNKHAGTAIDSGHRGKGGNIYGYALHGGHEQQWVFKKTGDGRSFEIVHRHSGLVLDIEGGRIADGTNIRLWEANGTAAQKFRFVSVDADAKQTIADGTYYIVSKKNEGLGLDIVEAGTAVNDNLRAHENVLDKKKAFEVRYLGNGYYGLTHKASGRRLDVLGDSYYNGSKVFLHHANDTDAQQWIIRDAGNGYYEILSKKKNLVLDLAAPNGDVSSGNAVSVFFRHGGDNQKWKFIKDIEGWKSNNKGWWYENADGSYPKNDWKQINNVWYHFDASGYMVTGWQKIDGSDYYFKSTGAMASDEWIDNKYYVDKSGRWIPNKAKSVAGWKSDNKGWWYENADGSYPKNTWKQINNVWYHFDVSGYMQTGWQKIGGSDYYFKSTGAMASDEWVDNKYYVDKSGRWIPNKTKSVAGWKSNNKGWWYENTDGSYPKNAWKQINNAWYYFDASGYMVTGWRKIDGSDYYFKSTGAMASDEWVDNKYYVDKSGRWIP